MKIKHILAAAALTLMCTAASAAEGEYVIVLKEPQQALNDSVTQLSSTVYTAPSYEAACAAFTADNIDKIFLDEPIDIIDYEFEENEVATLSGYPNDNRYNDQWYLPHIKASAAWDKGLTGEGVKVGIIDTGTNLAHVDLVSKTVDKFNCIPGADSDNVSDTYGHGAMVAGIIAAETNNSYCVSGIADDVDLAIVKVMENASVAPGISTLLAAISKTIEFECDVVNISLGWIPDDSDSAGFNAIRDEIKKGVNKGMIFTASAGNIRQYVNGDELHYPASFDGVVSVSSLGRAKTDSDDDSKPTVLFEKSNGTIVTILTDEPAETTIHNNKVFCSAPGFRIVSTFIGDSSKTAASDGTSFAAPMVAAAAAIAKQLDKTIDYARFSEYLKNSVRDIYTEGYDEYTGYGALDIASLIEVIEADISKPTPSPVPVSGFEAQITKDGDRYIINTMHDLKEDEFKIYAAAYCGGRLVALRSQSDSESEGRRFTLTTTQEADTVAVMVWTPDGVYPLTECVKQEFATPEPTSIPSLEPTQEPTEEPMETE